jgi:predicted nucleic acid-binding protein
MTAVADSSPLIPFGRASQLRLLQLLFGDLWIPPRVAQETYGDLTRPGALAVAAAVGHRIHERSPLDQVSVQHFTGVLDAGEAEAIVLASEHRLLLLIDDPAGRKAAATRRVPVLGSAGVAGLAKRHGLVPAAGPVLDQLMRGGLRLSRALYTQILLDAGEPTP